MQARKSFHHLCIKYFIVICNLKTNFMLSKINIKLLEIGRLSSIDWNLPDSGNYQQSMVRLQCNIRSDLQFLQLNFFFSGLVNFIACQRREYLPEEKFRFRRLRNALKEQHISIHHSNIVGNSRNSQELSPLPSQSYLVYFFFWEIIFNPTSIFPHNPLYS